jgi:hypothetical protein
LGGKKMADEGERKKKGVEWSGCVVLLLGGWRDVEYLYYK